VVINNVLRCAIMFGSGAIVKRGDKKDVDGDDT
jgi:hypothetical protein